MSTQTLTHHVGPNADHPVEAIQPYPGLYIYKQPHPLRTPDSTYTWRLGHHSGLAIAAFEYLDDADDAAWAIHQLTDWTQDADTITTHLSGDTVRKALEQSPGFLLTRKASQ